MSDTEAMPEGKKGTPDGSGPRKKLAITPAVVSLFIVSAAGIVGGLLFYLQSVDDLARQDRAKRVEIALDIETGKQQLTLGEYAYWDEAYEHSIPDADKQWLDRNMGRYVLERYGYDISLAADQGRTATFIETSGDASDVDWDTLSDSGVLQLMERSRDSASYRGITSGFMVMAGGIYLVSAGPFYKEGDTAPRPDYSFVVFGRLIDEEFVKDLGTTYQLPGLKLEPASWRGPGLPLVDIAGRVIGFFSWNQPSPAGAVLPKILLVTGAFFMVTIGLTMLIMSREHKNRIAEEQARAVMREAEETRRFKKRFMSSIGHELRTPLSNMLAMLSCLKHEGMPPDQMDALAVIMRSGWNLNRLINDVMDFTRMEKHDVGKFMAEFDPRATILSAHEILEPEAARKGLNMPRPRFTDMPDKLVGMEGAVRHILLNLVGNAVKFTSRGQVRVNAGYVAKDQQRGHLVLEVSDTGPGISEKDREMIFEPYTKLDEQTGTSKQGIGLGLSLVRSLVGTLGGSITLTSEPGKGSTFLVHLPVTPGKPGREA